MIAFEECGSRKVTCACEEKDLITSHLYRTAKQRPEWGPTGGLRRMDFLEIVYIEIRSFK